jgi:hypothetical protein
VPDPEDGMMVCDDFATLVCSRTWSCRFQRQTEHTFGTCTIVHHRGDLLQQVVMIDLIISINKLTDKCSDIHM